MRIFLTSFRYVNMNTISLHEGHLSIYIEYSINTNNIWKGQDVHERFFLLTFSDINWDYWITKRGACQSAPLLILYRAENTKPISGFRSNFLPKQFNDG